jgi:type I restriction enzyme R subunit
MSPAGASTRKVAESDLEDLALLHFAQLGYECIHGPDIAPEEPAAERAGFGDVVLRGRLEEALYRLNPEAPDGARAEALRRVLTPESATVLQNNRAFHRMLRDGVEVEVAGRAGEVSTLRLRLVDYDDPDAERLGGGQPVHDHRGPLQPAARRDRHGERPAAGGDRAQEPGDENASFEDAYKQLQTYQKQIPSLFTYNALLVISDGEARVGTISAGLERFAPWRTVDGQEVVAPGTLELLTLLHGVFDKRRLPRAGAQLRRVRGHLQGRRQEVRRLPSGRRGARGHPPDRARDPARRRSQGRRGLAHPGQRQVADHGVLRRPGHRRAGHGEPDRRGHHRPQRPRRSALRHVLALPRAPAPDAGPGRRPRRPARLLQVASGGVVFTTIQKFLPAEQGEKFPTLSDRRNIVVIADEAHRSQYGLKSKLVRTADGGVLVAGFAQHMRDALPNASFIGFTGTPIELTDKNTRAVFGDYISVYDIQRAVEDGATVPIYYESRLAKLSLDPGPARGHRRRVRGGHRGRGGVAARAPEVRWAALEAVVGDEKRVGGSPRTSSGTTRSALRASTARR